MRKYLILLLCVFIGGCMYSSANMIQAVAVEGESMEFSYGVAGPKIQGVHNLTLYRATNPPDLPLNQQIDLKDIEDRLTYIEDYLNETYRQPLRNPQD